jgi:hypothetical protein
MEVEAVDGRERVRFALGVAQIGGEDNRKLYYGEAEGQNTPHRRCSPGQMGYWVDPTIGRLIGGLPLMLQIHSS